MFTVKSALHQISFDGCTNIWPENFVMSRSLTASDQILDKIWRILKTEPFLKNIIVFLLKDQIHILLDGLSGPLRSFPFFGHTHIPLSNYTFVKYLLKYS